MTILGLPNGKKWRLQEIKEKGRTWLVRVRLQPAGKAARGWMYTQEE